MKLSIPSATRCFSTNLLWVSLVGVLAGCPPSDRGKATAKEPAPGKASTLVVHIDVNPPALLPTIHPDQWAVRITSHNVYEALLRYSPNPPYGLEGELATAWKIEEEGRVLTFELRRGVRWHDGKPFTARDVRFTLDRILDEKVRAASTRATLAPHIERYEVLGPHRFRIVCKKASPFFLHALPAVPIIPEHIFRDSDLNHHPRLRSPLGTGPYRFVRWRSGRDITLERHKGYWGKKASIERLVFRVVRSPQQALRLAHRGELDFLPRLHGSQLGSALENDVVLRRRFRRIQHVTPGTSYVLLNHRRSMFSDVRVRRALSLLLDVETIVTHLMRGQAKRISSLYWMGDPDCDQGLRPTRFDPAAAVKLLDSVAADSDGDGIREVGGKPFRFTFFVVAASRTTRRWATIYQQQLKKAGIEMTIKPVEWAAYLQAIRRHDFDMGTLGMAFSAPYSDLYLQFHSSQADDGQNYGAYSNPEADRLMAAIRREMDPKKRRAQGTRLQHLLAADVAAIPLFTLTEPGLLSRRVQGALSTFPWYRLASWRLTNVSAAQKR
ncbi:MAG: hypothetical protein JRH20_02990 [Deltaproteobacteria bacterium]|nr:hypothetical protein [Deltaproteobacteria bacterium]